VARRRRDRHRGAGTPAPAPARPPRRLRRRAGIAAGVIVVAAAAVLEWRRLEAPIVLPAPPAARAAQVNPRVQWADFVGAEACAECHAAEYAAWKGSTHAQAGGAPSRDLVIARFNGVPIRFRDATVVPRVTPKGEYQFVVTQAGRPEVALTVTGVIGGGHMVGGGTQGFVGRQPDGTVRFLPFDFSRQASAWFCNTIGRANKGWIPITPELPLEACVDWPPQRILGTDNRFSNCQECHGSQIELSYNERTTDYETRYKDLRINCESCHGPGRRHIELARAGALDTASDIGLRPLTTLTKDQSLEVCFQCHALKDVLAPGYLPGDSLLAHYALGLEALGERPWFPDGRVRTFAYQANHRFSDCYRDGSMTCTDCHDPHSQRYRDIWGRPLRGRFDDGQCTDCHASKLANVSAHTHHPAGSPGASCVACHMPYLQQPDLGHALRYARSDHTIAIPRPAFDAALGIEGACRQCHRGQSVDELQHTARAWWGEIKPQSPLVVALSDIRDTTSFATAARVLLRPELHHPMAQMEALAELLDRYLQPDMAALDEATIGRLELLAANDDPDVQATALAALHFAAGNRRAVRRFLARTLEGLGSRETMIRARWKIVLAYVGDTYRGRDDDPTALIAYDKALEVAPNDAAILSHAGLAQAGGGRWPEAVESYRASLRLDPLQPLTLVNLGLALEQQHDEAGATAAYQRALAIDPRNGVALLDLGNMAFRHGDRAQAIALYRRAIVANVGLAAAHFNVARAYALTNRLAEARAELTWGLAFEPGNTDAQQMLAQLEQMMRR
jgi:tetratricopeptide (TPR) repeat protein